MGRLASRRRVCGLCAVFLLGLVTAQNWGCASYSTGAYHTVAKGENLYRIGQQYGVPVDAIVRANGIDDVTALQIGERVWIPRSGNQSVRGRNSDGKAARVAARKESRKSGNIQFVWPVRGARLSSDFGMRRGRSHEGIDLAIRPGAPIRAAEAGRVVHSGWLGDYGKVVIIKHAGYYRTVYAHASRLYVSRGEFVDRGQKIALVGTTGRSTGPHLHFEIRKRESPRNPIPYLP